MKNLIILATLPLLLLQSCSSGSKTTEVTSAATGSASPPSTNGAPNPLELAPPALPELGADVVWLAIAGTNDMHGALSIQKTKTRERPGVNATEYERGGASILASHLKVLRERFGKRLLWLDAGDEFQGTLESNLTEGAPMVTFYNATHLDAAAIGNHEFDFGPVGPEGTEGDPLGALKQRILEAKYPYLSANMLDKRTGRFPKMPKNAKASELLTVDGISVGVIGLSTLYTPVTTRPTFVKDLKFTDLAAATQREAKRLRARGAKVILVTAHVGAICKSEGVNRPHQLRTIETVQGACDETDELTQYLNKLPQGTIDGIVAGHTHSIIHHWINGVPVIQGGTRTVFYNVIYLPYDRKTGKVLIVHSRIEGPISICPKVFSNTRDCNGDVPMAEGSGENGGRGRLITAKFHGKEIKPDAEIEAVLKPIFDSVESMKTRVIGKASRAIPHDRQAEGPMGNLVADAIRAAAKADFAVVNGGGIRAPLDEGNITYGDLYRTLPFDNFVAILSVTGAELIQVIELAQSGERGVFPVSGLRVKLHREGSSQITKRDLNGDGKKEHWETDRVAEVRTEDGAAIDPKKMYRLATIDFLVQGGDDMGFVFKKIPGSRVQMAGSGMMRDVTESYIKQLMLKHPGGIHSADAPLVDKTSPRFFWVE